MSISVPGSGSEYQPESGGPIVPPNVLQHEPAVRQRISALGGARSQLGDLPQRPLKGQADSDDRLVAEASPLLSPAPSDTVISPDRQRLIVLCTYEGVFDQELYDFIVKTQRGCDTITESDCNQIKYWCTGKDGKLNRTLVGYVVEAQVLSKSRRVV